MGNILIVDDSPIDQKRTALVLEGSDHTVRFAENGIKALELIAEDIPDIVLTDLVMPEMDGLALLENIVEKYSTVPVILMTAHGNEEVAVQALHAGAASYVPKKSLANHLLRAVENTLATMANVRELEQVLDWRTHLEEQFVLSAACTRADALVLHIQNALSRAGICKEAGIFQVSTALTEALVNAIEHGALELDSRLREDEDGAYAKLAELRRKQSPFKERNVYVSAKLTREDATIVIRDEGPGFDPSTIPDPRDPANLEKISGRGLILIQTFMDAVSFNDRGNEITMVKKK